MFTGLVTDIGSVERLTRSTQGLRLRIATAYDVTIIPKGASIACAGVCLTVVETGKSGRSGWFEVEAVPQTLALSTLGDIVQGAPINLERPLKMGDELGGHAVLGHVDGVAKIMSRQQDGGSVRFGFRAPGDLWRFIAAKGSVTLDGTSLTVTDVDGDEFGVAIIPHTLDVTTWRHRTVGDRVNLEIDVLARYMQRLVETSTQIEKAGQ
ncbi:Riboflavin synthase eubacterial/eukaryotic [hydrothermal vent metagenome]|uniref:Riboflavin synthase n=1 Tax=hydrothermal vent metagenome TaxID=652676 RepID=A0A3B0TK71_9ZZZZ